MTTTLGASPQASQSQAVSLDGVCLAIGEVDILDSVTFDVAEGETVGLIGANGSGKSSILNVMSGYYSPTAGAVRVRGHDVTKIRAERVPRYGVGRSFQSVGAIKDLTVRELIALGVEPAWPSSLVASLLGLRAGRSAERSALDRAGALADEYGLGQFIGVRLDEAPYGVRKMADLLRVFVGEPSVLLLDEPASGVAKADRSAIVDLISQWRERSGGSVVLVDHDVAFVVRLASRLVALSSGRVVAVGPVDHVLRDDAVVESFLGSSA
ncbi:ABC transporter ATP-binding protein [Aeromicrobium terrae]|uniref:ABC transporter ATP-binding protein n=1 Tax=Aeromicrobium terrae TaxID=2498846 RepID=A0A5C8NID6_9ACTN|nr:ATP-binding cassette domain-containing protein [Aeromicrobium terrae]TXL60747.1 ABC transporter ATP-binding protein [Aeromicrobium terrae]